MNIIESFIASKYGDMSLCEDGLFVNENYIAVVDGVTPKGNIKWQGRTSGFFAKELLLEALGRLKGEEDPFKVLQLLNQALFEQYENKIEFFREHTEERLRATIVIYSRTYNQIWCFGDCQYMINEKAFKQEMKIDQLLAEVRSVYLHLEMLGGKTQDELLGFDTSQEIIFPVIKKQLYFSNNSYSGAHAFNVLDGFCENFDRLIIQNVEKAN